MTTRRRFVNASNTHTPEFQEAFKTRKRAEAATRELDELADVDESKLDGRQKGRLHARIADLQDKVAGFDELPHSQKKLLETEDVEVVEIETVSGPRRVFADRVGDYEQVGVTQ